MLSDDRLRSMLALVADEATPSPAFLDELWDDLKAERRGRATRWGSGVLPVAATLAALLLLLLALIALIGNQNPPTIEGIGQIELAGAPERLVAGDGVVVVGWPGNMGRVDTRATSLPGTTIDINDFAYGPAGWWVAEADVVRRWAPSGPQGWSPATGRVIEVHATAIAVGEHEVVVQTGPGALAVFDTATGAQVTGLTVEGGIVAFAIRAGVVWVITGTPANQPNRDGLHAIDIESGQERGPPIAVVAYPTGIVVGSDSLWVLGRGKILRIDPATATLRSEIRLGFTPAAIAIDPHGYPWVAGGRDMADPGSDLMLARIDPATEVAAVRLVSIADLGLTVTNLSHLAVTDDTAWIGIYATRVSDVPPFPSLSSLVRVPLDPDED